MASITQHVRQIKSDLSAHLRPDLILAACQHARYDWRERILGPVLTVQAFLLQVLHGNTAMTNVARLVGVDFTPSAYCQARRRLPLAVLKILLRRLVTGARDATAEVARWRGHRTFLVDGSSCSMPDTPALQRCFGQPTGQRPGCGFPVAHLLALFDAHTGLLVDVLASSWRLHDLVRVGELHPHLQPGDLLLADRGFCSFAHLALLIQRGVQAVIRVHGQRRVQFGQPYRPYAGVTWSVRLGRDDQLTLWRKTAVPSRVMSRAAYDALPELNLVRELRYRVSRPGYRTRCVTLVTTLLNPQTYPAAALAELYQQRWQAETNLRHLKETLGMRVLHSHSVAGFHKELLAFALVYNLVCLLRTAVARELGVAPARVSFVDALRALRHAPRRGLPRRLVCNPMRPGRYEPRVRKRRPLQYSLMTKPRDELRKALMHETTTA